MPLFKASLRFAHDTSWAERKRWSNSFFLDVANVSSAVGALAGAWVSFLRPAVHNTVFAYEVYATDLSEGTEVFQVISIPSGQQRGTMALPNDGEAYLTKACIAVTLNVTGSRPSRKFWRPGLYEGDVEQGRAPSAALASAIQTAFGEFVTGLGEALVDPDGQVISGVGRMKLTTREFGRAAGSDLPVPPPVG